MNQVNSRLPSGQTKKPPSIITFPSAAPYSYLKASNNSVAFNSFNQLLKSKGIHLNRQQCAILQCPAQHVMVNALAGTGKTSSLIALAAYHAYCGIPAQSILLLAYTKDACNEMKNRLHRLFPQYNINVCTLHSLCYRLLRSNGYSEYKVIAGESERLGILKRQISVHYPDAPYEAEELAQLYSYYRNTLTEPQEDALRNLFENFDMSKRRRQLMDFDDFQTLTYQLLQLNKPLLSRLQDQQKVIIVDEFQDVCPIQYEIIKLLCGSQCRLSVFGDPFQSIFSFRGSAPSIFTAYKTAYRDAAELSMTMNYRCTEAIADVANILLDEMDCTNLLTAVKRSGLPPRLIRSKSSLEEAQAIASEIKGGVSKGQRTYSDYCILYRSATAAAALLHELTEANIPFLTLGALKSIYEQPAAKYILRSLKAALENPTTEFQYEIRSQTPQDALSTLLEDDAVQEALYPPNLPGQTHQAIADTINQLTEIAAVYNTLQEFINYTQKVNSRSQFGTKDNAVTLSTIHSAKGSEWSCVYLLACIEDVLPHKNVTEPNLAVDKSIPMIGSLEEEQRLLYVAITRAKEELTISAPMKYNNQLSQLSRFLYPLESELHFTELS